MENAFKETDVNSIYESCGPSYSPTYFFGSTSKDTQKASLSSNNQKNTDKIDVSDKSPQFEFNKEIASCCELLSHSSIESTPHDLQARFTSVPTFVCSGQLSTPATFSAKSVIASIDVLPENTDEEASSSAPDTCSEWHNRSSFPINLTSLTENAIHADISSPQLIEESPEMKRVQPLSHSTMTLRNDLVKLTASAETEVIDAEKHDILDKSGDDDFLQLPVRMTFKSEAELADLDLAVSTKSEQQSCKSEQNLVTSKKFNFSGDQSTISLEFHSIDHETNVTDSVSPATVITSDSMGKVLSSSIIPQASMFDLPESSLFTPSSISASHRSKSTGLSTIQMHSIEKISAKQEDDKVNITRASSKLSDKLYDLNPMSLSSNVTQLNLTGQNRIPQSIYKLTKQRPNRKSTGIGMFGGLISFSGGGGNSSLSMSSAKSSLGSVIATAPQTNPTLPNSMSNASSTAVASQKMENIRKKKRSLGIDVREKFGFFRKAALDLSSSTPPVICESLSPIASGCSPSSTSLTSSHAHSHAHTLPFPFNTAHTQTLCSCSSSYSGVLSSAASFHTATAAATSGGGPLTQLSHSLGFSCSSSPSCSQPHHNISSLTSSSDLICSGSGIDNSSLISGVAATQAPPPQSLFTTKSRMMQPKQLERLWQQLGRPDLTHVDNWNKSFEFLLHDPHGIALFREFLRGEFSDENIEFWTECENFRGITDKKQMKNSAQSIYEEYVTTQSPREVNLDADTRNKTLQNINAENADEGIFDMAQKKIQALMEKDSYRRFLRSELYKTVREICVKDAKLAAAASATSSTAGNSALSLSNMASLSSGGSYGARSTSATSQIPGLLVDVKMGPKMPPKTFK